MFVDDQLCGFCIQLAVKGDDAAKGGFWICRKGELVGSFDVGCHGHATRVGVFNDDTSWLVKQLDGFQCGVGVGNVVERQLFTLQLFGGGNRSFLCVFFNVERRFLVRVFTVAHVLCLDVLNVVSVGKIAGFVFCVATTEVIGDHAVVLGGVLKGFDHQLVTGLIAGGAAIVLHLGNDGIVVAGIHHNVDVFVVLSG